MSTKPSSTATAPAATGALKVVVRFKDGRLVKGTTLDFVATKPLFHISETGNEAQPAVRVEFEAVKAVFFVKTYEGRRLHNAEYNFEKSRSYGRRCLVMFCDGEVVAGFTAGYSAERQGFFLVPADIQSNNSRIYIVNDAVRTLTWV